MRSRREALIPPTLRGYKRSWLGADVVAGLTLAAIALPSQMATARLAGMPAIAGLDAFVAGSIVFVVIGRSRQMSVGADSTIAPVLAAAVGALSAQGTHAYPGLIALMAVMVGAIVLVLGLARLGWIADFLSTPVVAGVLAGIAVSIVVRQLPAVLGIPAGGTTTIGRARHIIGHLGRVNGWSAGVAGGVLAIMLAAGLIDRRVPGALIGLVASIVAVTAIGLKAHGVGVIGAVNGGLPSVRIPSGSWTDVTHLIVPALTVSFLCVAQTAATRRESRTAAAASADFNRDLIAVGAGSVVSGVVGSFAVDSSPPNTAIVIASGGRSQLTHLVALAIVGAVVLFVTGPLDNLPDATLGAMLIFVATRLLRVRELRAVLRFDRIEFALTVITVLVVALIGIEQGVVVAMLLSLAVRTRRTARPHDAVLGCEPGTDHWIPPDIGRPIQQVPGVVVYLLYGPLWYGNADFVTARVQQLIDAASPPAHAFVLDADGIADIDYTGLRALTELIAALDERGVSTGIARASHLVHHDLKHGDLLTRLGANRLFDSVAAAVEQLTPGSSTPR